MNTSEYTEVESASLEKDFEALWQMRRGRVSFPEADVPPTNIDWNRLTRIATARMPLEWLSDVVRATPRPLLWVFAVFTSVASIGVLVGLYSRAGSAFAQLRSYEKLFLFMAIGTLITIAGMTGSVALSALARVVPTRGRRHGPSRRRGTQPRVSLLFCYIIAATIALFALVAQSARFVPSDKSLPFASYDGLSIEIANDPRMYENVISIAAAKVGQDKDEVLRRWSTSPKLRAAVYSELLSQQRFEELKAQYTAQLSARRP